MKNQKRIVTLFAFVALGMGQGSAYTNAQYGFSATTPAGWKQGSYPGTAVTFASPKIVQAFAPNINVIVQALPGGTTLKAVNEATLSQIKTLITDGKVISQKATTLNGLAATQLVYTGRQGQYKLYFTRPTL